MLELGRDDLRVLVDFALECFELTATKLANVQQLARLVDIRCPRIRERQRHRLAAKTTGADVNEVAEHDARRRETHFHVTARAQRHREECRLGYDSCRHDERMTTQA